MEYSSDLQLQALQRQNLLTILQQEKFTDIQFIVGPQKKIFKANRALLASISTVFEKRLYGEHDKKQETEISLSDIEASAFESLLNFAYCNDPQLNVDNVLSVKYICDKFKVTSLSSFCSSYWSNSLNAKNICILLNQSILINSTEFIKECQEYLNKFVIHSIDIDVILKSVGFLKMNLKSMIVFLQIDNLKIEENILWEYILKWADYQCNNIEPGAIVVSSSDDAKEEKKYDTDNPFLVHNKLNSEDFHNALAAQIEEVYPEENDKNVPWKMNIIQPKDRMSLLQAIKPYIRWGAMDGNYFVKKVKNEGIFDKDELITILTYFQCPDEGCGDFQIERRTPISSVCIIQRGDIELAKWTYPGGRKIDGIAFESSKNVYLRGIGIFNCAGKCTAKVKVYRGDNGKYNGMDIVGETNEETFDSEAYQYASPKPIELKLKKAIKLEEYQKYTIELLQRNENEAVSYQIKNGQNEVIDEELDNMEITFLKAAVSKNGTNVQKGAIPTLYFEV